MRDHEIDLALARAVLYRSLGHALRRPLADGAVPFFDREALFATEEAAGLLDAGPGSEEKVGPAVAAFALGGVAPCDGVRVAHDRLFGHARGLVCPFETEYGSEGAFEQPQALADLAGTYRAFGLVARPGHDERVDHVSCECEFMEFLARKEAFVLAGSGDAVDADGAPEDLEVVREAARGFLRAHLGRFGRAFGSNLIRHDPGGLHAALGGVLFLFLAQESRRFGLPVGPAVLELRPPVEDPTPMACGANCGLREPPGAFTDRSPT